MYLKRKAYDEMAAWKKRPGHSALEVSGARQVGKTYLVNRFADEQYGQKIYINLMELTGDKGGRLNIRASSTGGGRIRVDELDGVEVDFTGDYNTLIIQNMDNQDNLSEVTTALSLAQVNVANMGVRRSSKGGSVMMIIETDDPVPDAILQLIENRPGILQVIHYRKED